MGLPQGEVAPKVTDWVQFKWEQDAKIPMSIDEKNELLAEIDAINAAAQTEKEKT